MLGLGRMGGNMAQRLARRGHQVIGYDPGSDARAEFTKKGLTAAASVEALIKDLRSPRTVWMMIPAGAPVDAMIATLTPFWRKATA